MKYRIYIGIALIAVQVTGCASGNQALQRQHDANASEIAELKANCDAGRQSACIDYEARIQKCRDTQKLSDVDRANLDVFGAMAHNPWLACAGLENEVANP